MNSTEEVVMETAAALSRLELQVKREKDKIIGMTCYSPAFQENISSIEWDDPQQALLI